MYSVKYSCSNCGKTFFKHFPYGHPAPERTTCLNYGVNGAKKCWPSGRKTQVIRESFGWGIPRHRLIPKPLRTYQDYQWWMIRWAISKAHFFWV